MGSDHTGLGLVDRGWRESRDDPVMLPGPRSMGSTPSTEWDVSWVMRRLHRGSATPVGPTGVSGSDHPPSEGPNRSSHFTDEENVQGRDGGSSQDASWGLASSLGAGAGTTSRGLTSQGREDPWPPG